MKFASTLAVSLCRVLGNIRRDISQPSPRGGVTAVRLAVGERPERRAPEAQALPVALLAFSLPLLQVGDRAHRELNQSRKLCSHHLRTVLHLDYLDARSGMRSSRCPLVACSDVTGSSVTDILNAGLQEPYNG